MEENTIYLNALNHLSGLGAVTINKLLKKFGSARAVWDLPQNTIDQLGLPKNIRGAFDERKKYDPHALTSKLTEHGIETMALNSPEYPKLLGEIYDPPPLLYLRGNKELLHAAGITIVGTRKASTYGRKACEKFAKPIATAGICVISGLAFGIDTIAHKTTLENNGQTIAVLASGLDFDVIYPRDNLKLAAEIVDRGLLVSERPPRIYPQKHNFPVRNRISSGLSRATLVVEAPERSGALITAHTAIDQNREVFAVPGNINHPNSAGTNKLIKKSIAHLTNTPNDILEFFNIKRSSSSNNRQNQRSSLTDIERILYNALLNETQTLDELKRQIKIDTQTLLGTLTSMELKKIIIRDTGNRFQVLKNL